MTVVGTVGVTVRVISPSRSSERSVCVSIFWLTPASFRDSSEYRIGRACPTRSGSACGSSPPSAARISATHLSEIRPSICRLGHAAR